MDYARIYDRFIENRRLLAPVGITESHHITPRSLGGDDRPENLIDLTPEDHFFAHLLLAKAYGGMLWVPVVMWLGGDRRNWKGRRSRLDYGWARRAATRSFSGKGAHQYDHTQYIFEHKDGRVFTGTQAEFYGVHSLTRSGVCLLLKGKIASIHGWYIQGNRPERFGPGNRFGMNHPMARPEIIKFRNVDGREFVGTQFELHITHGVSKAGCCTLVQGKRTISKGWYVEGRPPNGLGRGASYLRAQAQAPRDQPRAG